jgi:aspartate/methionine/tyrosine aminotransferase
MRVLEEAGVAITPGCDFGVHRARAHVRFAYTRSMADLEEGVERLARFLASA